MEEGHESEDKIVTSDLAGQTIAYYFRLFRWPVLGVLAAEIVLIIFDQRAVYLWFINLLLFVGLTFWFKKTYKANIAQSLILGGSAGLVLGFLVALFKLIWRLKLYLLFNLVTETILTMLFGLLISAGTYMVLNKEYKEQRILPFKLNIRKKDKNYKKGGEINGREIKSRGKSGK